MRRPRFALAKAKADALLQAARIRKPPVDVESLARHAGATVRYRPYGGDDDMAGALIRRPGGVVIGVNLNDSPQRQRFTIAHEIGHLLLHDEELHVDERMMLFRDRDSTTAKDATEVEANQFASHLLMPAFMLQKDVDDVDFVDIDETAERLAKRYDVSVPSMTLRLAKFLKYGL